MSLEELLALHIYDPKTDRCGCGRTYPDPDTHARHLAEMVRTSYVLVGRPSPVLGEPLVEFNQTRHLVFVLFPPPNELRDRVSADARILADEIAQAFKS